VIGLQIAKRHVDRMVLVPDDTIALARTMLWEETKILPEPGAATPLAALLAGAYVPQPDERVGLVICGANADPATLDPPRASMADDTD
jgi:threonine dehydratase